tara:strand:+ start:318 stop:890 length:573 start_codon:yes stop_codon:yes gene_type:complete
MKYILFYSNYCKHSNELLIQIGKTGVQQEINFICIDKRKRENGSSYAILKNGKSILIPNSITSVPSMILLNYGNKIITGPEIINFLNETIVKSISRATNGQMEPACYSISEMGGLSDPYSYLEISTDNMLAKGDGGAKITHDYSFINFSNNNIETPPEGSKPSDYKLSTIDVDSIRKNRENEIPKLERRI